MLQNIFEATDDGIYFAFACDDVYTTSGDGYWSDVVKAVRLEGMGMFVGTVNEADEGEAAMYFDGDFYVTYDETTWDMDTDGLIYTDSAFLEQVKAKMRDVLVQLGVDANSINEAVGDMHYSEQGMQDYGRVSLDAFVLAEVLRNCYKQQNTVLA